jgi:hypothetical protein
MLVVSAASHTLPTVSNVHTHKQHVTQTTTSPVSVSLQHLLRVRDAVLVLVESL